MACGYAEDSREGRTRETALAEIERRIKGLQERQEKLEAAKRFIAANPDFQAVLEVLRIR